MADVIRPPYPGVLPPELIGLSPNVWTEPFWQAAAEHRLVIPRCARCGTHRMPPSPFCWSCHSQDLEWDPHPGTGTCYSFTVIRHAVIPDVVDALPIVAAVVELDGVDGCRLVGDLVDCSPEDVTIGDRVELVWYEAHEHATVPCFRLAGDGR